MIQKAFHCKDYPGYVVDFINDLISEGWRIVAMTSIEPVGDSNQMEAVIVAEKRSEGPCLL
jgi:hypothetical protein